MNATNKFLERIAIALEKIANTGTNESTSYIPYQQTTMPRMPKFKMPNYKLSKIRVRPKDFIVPGWAEMPKQTNKKHRGKKK